MAKALVYEDDATGWRQFQNGDLPTSGVTAATYGDATHVAQVAVNAQGIVTGASNVAITGGSGTVTNVSSANAGIAVANPTTTPVLTLAGLDTIVSAVGVAADWANGGHKITNLANGTNATDAAAFGQIPTVPGGAGFSTLFDSTLNSDAATIDTGAGGVGQGSNHLLILYIARTDQAVGLSSVLVTLNNDGGGNYDRATWQVTNTAGAGATAFGATSWGLNAAGASQGASRYAAGFIILPAYTQTTAFKQGYHGVAAVDSSGTSSRASLAALLWRSTVAISQVTMTVGGGTVMKAGSRLSIYGLG